MDFLYKQLYTHILRSCFPHVINLAVKAALQRLTTVVPTDFVPDDDFSPLSDLDAQISNTLHMDFEYHQALQNDVIAEIRKLCVTVRSSIQRRDQFRSILRAGNEDGEWGINEEDIPDVMVKRDVETRWGSIYFMVDRFLITLPVSLLHP